MKYMTAKEIEAWKNEWLEKILKECKVAFETLPVETQGLLLDWINKGFLKTKTISNRYTSYGLKHQFENDTKIYIDNEMFKHAMLLSGFEVKNKFDLNWCFNLSLKSPVLKENHSYDMLQKKIIAA